MGRIIDADALKKVIFSKTDSMEDLWDTAGVLNLINNAPTVEITEKQAILLLINSGWLVNHDKELREKWERPQGDCESSNNSHNLCNHSRFMLDRKEEIMSRNKDIKLLHEITGCSYKECRRRMKANHWDLGLALLPHWVKAFNNLGLLEPIRESFKTLADGISNSLTVLDEWLTEISNPFEQKGEEI